MYSSVKWDKEQNGLDLDAAWGNFLILEHSGFSEKCLWELTFLCAVVLGIAMRLGKEIIYNSFPWGSQFVLLGRI